MKKAAMPGGLAMESSPTIVSATAEDSRAVLDQDGSQSWTQEASKGANQSHPSASDHSVSAAIQASETASAPAVLPSTQVRKGKPDLVPSGKANPCPICGRAKDGDCRIGAEIVLCHHGKTHHPPAGLRPGNTTTGADGREWAFTGDTSDGMWATYKLHNPRDGWQAPTSPERCTKDAESVWRYSETFIVCRFPGKKIRPLSWDGSRWMWKAPKGRRPLLNLSRVKANSEARVLVVEGEKTCDAATTLFQSLAVTTWSGGCRATHLTDWSCLEGRKVVLWPDNDAAGRDAMKALAQILHDAGAASVKVVANPPDAPDGWDLADADWMPEQAAYWMEANSSEVLSTTTRNAASFLAIGQENGYQLKRKATEASSKANADPARAEVERRSFRELLADALAAIRRRDEDTEMEARAEIMGRFKRSDAQITAALFRLLTEQETGRPAGDAPHSDALDLDAVEGMDALVDGFMPANDLGLAYGAKGSGKTAAALGLSFAVIEGAGFLDHARATEPGAVLFIASDSGAAPLKAEMQRMGLSDHPTVRGDEQRFYVWAYSAAQRTTAWCASINGCVELLQFVKAKGVRLVVIDSAKTICAKAGISYLDNDSIAALLTFMKETICAYASVLILSHDGTEKGSHSGAKAWAEVPSIVHNIQQIPDAPQERLWRVVKNRMGALRELRYQLGEDGRLEPVVGVEVIGDASAAVLRVLAEAHARGVESVSNKELVAEIGRRFRLAPKTVANTLTRMVGGSKPEICRVSSKRGHYKLAPRLLADPLKGVRVLGDEEAQTPVTEMDLASSRHLPEGRTREERVHLPESSHFPRVGKTQPPIGCKGSEDVSSRDIEIPMGSWLVELPPPATVGSGADAFGDDDDPHWPKRR